jgi:hypothetical protein
VSVPPTPPPGRTTKQRWPQKDSHQGTALAVPKRSDSWVGAALANAVRRTVVGRTVEERRFSAALDRRIIRGFSPRGTD